jgi:DNA-binding SARP family transcriptional activator
MRIDMLGPLSVTVDNRIATPTAAKPRRLLVLLAICANSVVRNERTIEELWEDRPPVSVATTLQTYIYQLRKHLHLTPAAMRAPVGQHRGGPTLLHTYPGGYMLAMTPEALDAQRFERLARLGRAQLDGGRYAAAAQTLRDALALWRGPALVDLDPGPVLQVEIQRLEEIRRSAFESRIDADLHLRRHHGIIAELVGLVAQQPTHEGFQARLMLALYRAGRRSDALNVFRKARHTLIDELGVEPSVGLQSLHQAILASAPRLEPVDPPVFV